MKKTYVLLLVTVFVNISYFATAQTEATFYTTKGEFTVQLYDTMAPVTVDSFLSRVADKFYDGLTFHRVIDGFMIQGGDPKGNGTGNAGYTLPDEFHPMASNVQKTISMANSGPNSGSCQFFINLVDNTFLDYNKPPASSKHPVFGIVTKNFSVVQAIGKTPTTGSSGNPADKPLTDMVMDSIRVTKFAASVEQFYTQKNTVKIYPNPTTGKIFSIDIPEYKTHVIITDITGKEVFSTTTTTEKTLTIDLSHKYNVRGIYLVRLSSTKGDALGRVVVQ